MDSGQWTMVFGGHNRDLPLAISHLRLAIQMDIGHWTMVNGQWLLAVEMAIYH
jgi:hypothetical protein